MAGIAGINKPYKFDIIGKLLGEISHRGNGGKEIFSLSDSTFGIVYSRSESIDINRFKHGKFVSDTRSGYHFAQAKEIDGCIELSRDMLGVVPLYYGLTYEGMLCFASEIKSLAGYAEGITELPPGGVFYKNRMSTQAQLELPDEYLSENISIICSRLFGLLDGEIKKLCSYDQCGCWLSGGLDSSVIAALANRYLDKLYTFSVGLKGSEDLEFSGIMAEHLQSKHIEITVDVKEMISLLPDIIYHLESFDALLVRSSIMNFSAARIASDYTGRVLSGEGGDELFAGYLFLKELPEADLPVKLLGLINKLHNTALQRVDRCASAFSLSAHLPFLIPDLVDYAIRIPAGLKINNGIEKWILREAFRKTLPDKIFKRTKSKFWEGSGVQDLLSRYADEVITDTDFNNNRLLHNGIVLRSKEEFLYYKLFEEHFGKMDDLSFLGFTDHS